MKKLIILLLILTSCKSSFFAYERPVQIYDDKEKILVVKLSKQAIDYSIYKMRAIEAKIPFYIKTEFVFTVGDTILYANIHRGPGMIRYL